MSTTDVLAALRVPEGTNLLDIVWDRNRDRVTLYLEGHPDLPVVADGELTPVVTLEVHRDGSAVYSR